MKADEIVYQLIVEDMQRVAIQEIDRKLTNIEIQKIRDCIGENIDWYNAISLSIEKHLGDEFHRSN